MEDHDDSEFLDLVAEQVLEDLEAGIAPDVAALTAARPYLAAEARRLVRTLRDVVVVGADPPPHLPGFTISGEVGRGGMGRVFLAGQDQLGGRPVALKVWRRACVSGGQWPDADAAVEQLRLEASILARVRHPGVITVHDVIAHEGSVAIAMEWIEGATLAGTIEVVVAVGRDDRSGLGAVRSALGQDAGSMTDPSYLAWTCRVGVQVARALGAAHRAGVLHRDVKPSNILIRRDGTALLSDFGLATLERGGSAATGRFAGTLAYAAPEQVAGREVDARSDIYALGATLFHAMALRRPHEIDATETRRPAPRLRTVDPRVPPDLELIIDMAMAESPYARYRSADELADDLERLLRLEPVRARPTSRAYVMRKFVARNRLAVGAALAVLLALAGGLAAALVGWRDAVQSRDRADASAARGRMSQYVASIQAAAASLRSDDTALAAQQLDAAPESLRGWEWRYLHGQLDRTLGTIFEFPARSPEGVAVKDLAVDLVGRRLAAITNDGKLGVIDLPAAGYGAATSVRVLDLRAGMAFDPISLRWHASSNMLIVGEWHGPRVLFIDPNTLEVGRSFQLPAGTDHVVVDCSTDGEFLAVHTTNGKESIVEVRSNSDCTVLARPTIHEKVDEVRFVGSGEWLFLKTDRSATVLNWRTNERLPLDVRVDGGGQSRDDIAASADGSRLAIGNRWVTQVWSLSPLRPVATLAAQSPFAKHCLAFSGDGERLFSYDGPRVRGWDIASGREVLAGRTGLGSNNGRAICVSPDGRFVYTGHDDGSVRGWPSQTPPEPMVVSCPEGGAISTTFTLVACHADGRDNADDPRRVALRSPATGDTIAEILMGSAPGLRGGRWSEFSPDGRWLLQWTGESDKADGHLCARELATGTMHERTLRITSQRVGSGPCLLGDRLLMATPEGLALLAFPTLETLRTLSAPGPVRFLSRSRDGSRIVVVAATTSRSCTILILEADSLRELHQIRWTIPMENSYPMAFARGRDSLLVTVDQTADLGSRIDLTDAATGDRLDSWAGPDAGYPGVTFDPSGNRLAVGFKDGTIRLFALAPMPPRGTDTLTELMSFRTDLWMLRPWFSDDGTRLACGTVWPSNRLFIWDARPEADRLSQRVRPIEMGTP